MSFADLGIPHIYFFHYQKHFYFFIDRDQCMICQVVISENQNLICIQTIIISKETVKLFMYEFFYNFAYVE